MNPVLRLSFPACLLAVSLLAACGGSGGGAELTPPPPAQNLPITAANGEAATKSSFQAANESADMTDLLGNSGFVAGTGGGYFKIAAPRTGALVNLLSKIPFGPNVLPCAVTGSITVSGDLADPFTLTAGDTINVDADNCDDGIGESTDGLLEFTVDAFAGDFLAGAYDLTMSMILTDFQVTTAADVLVSNGDATVNLNTLAAPAVSAAVSGFSMTTDSNAGSQTLSSYLSTQTLDAGLQPAPYTLSSAGNLVSSELSGPVTYSTPVTFQGFDADYPDSGELLVIGENSSARLIAIDNVNVLIEIDDNGDGIVDVTIETTWAALMT